MATLIGQGSRRGANTRTSPSGSMPRRPVRALALIWMGWLAVILGLGLLNSATEASVVAAEVMVILHAWFALLVIARCHDKTTAIIIGLSLICRTGLVFWDMHFSDIFQLPNSGADSEMYYYWATEVARDPHLILQFNPGETYSNVVGLLFWVTGPLRIVGQYMNALFGLSVVLLMSDLLDRFTLRDVQRMKVLTVIALLPNAMILSSIFLRESIASFLVATSVYFFVRWAMTGGALNVVGMTIAIIAASTFHAGVIAVGVGYMIVVPFYKRGQAKFGFTWQTVLYGVFFAAVIYFVVAQHPDLFLGKFEGLGTEAELLRDTNYRDGGSQYLSDLTVNSYGDLLRNGPLRGFYFLASPLPWDFRGVLDALTFLMDSLFYIGIPMMFLLRNRGLGRRAGVLGCALIVILAIASLLFGAGVSNAGTAARHRFKLIGLVMALAGLTAGAIKHRWPNHGGGAGDRPGQSKRRERST